MAKKNNNASSDKVSEPSAFIVDILADAEMSSKKSDNDAKIVARIGDISKQIALSFAEKLNLGIHVINRQSPEQQKKVIEVLSENFDALTIIAIKKVLNIEVEYKHIFAIVDNEKTKLPYISLASLIGSVFAYIVQLSQEKLSKLREQALLRNKDDDCASLVPDADATMHLTVIRKAVMRKLCISGFNKGDMISSLYSVAMSFSTSVTNTISSAVAAVNDIKSIDASNWYMQLCSPTELVEEVMKILQARVEKVANAEYQGEEAK